MVSKFFRRIFNTALIGTMCLLLGLTFTMTAFAASPGDVGVWADTTSLPQNLSYANSVTYGGYAYVIGGDNGGSLVNTVYYAPLNLNGTVGAWTATTTLPQTLSASTSVVYNGYVYVMGGQHGALVNTVYSAPLNPDGTVGAWTTSVVNTLPQTINGSTSIAYDGYIYVMGGFNSTYQNTVYSAPVNDGTVGVWATSLNTLPKGLQDSSAITYNGYAYVIGGFGSSGFSNAVYSAPLGSNGTIGTWATSPNTLPQGLDGHNAVSYGGYAYVIGGRGSSGFSSGFSNAVYSAPFGPNGTIGTWATSPNTLPQPLQYASAITYNGYVYNIGGSDIGVYVDDVYFAQLTGLPPPPSPGQPAPVAAPNTGFSQVSYLPAALVVVAGVGLVIIARRRYS